MQVSPPIVRVLACIVAAAAAFAPAVTLRGDVNGDHHVDVLDAQTVVAKLLAADSSVNIRDLQYVLARLDGSTKPDEPRTPDTPATLPPANPHDFWAHHLVAAVDTVQPVNHSDSRARRMELHPAVNRSTQTERYLFTLTANAPPLFA